MPGVPGPRPLRPTGRPALVSRDRTRPCWRHAQRTPFHGPHRVKPFELLLGIDYSGAKTPEAPLPGLRVAAAGPEPGSTRLWHPPAGDGRGRHWSRRAVAALLADQLRSGVRFLAGIDHGFSLPLAYFQRYALPDWPRFLADFSAHWPTHRAGVSVDDLRYGRLSRPAGEPAACARVGQPTELRLTDRWTASAKSVFQFDVQGSVAKSTHAGLPWLHWLRARAGGRLHIWPFDGWEPPADKAVLVEAYPSLVRRRYPREGRGADEHDAYAIARWLADMQARGALAECFQPPLQPDEREQALCEGWILGVR